MINLYICIYIYIYIHKIRGVLSTQKTKASASLGIFGFGHWFHQGFCLLADVVRRLFRIGIWFPQQLGSTKIRNRVFAKVEDGKDGRWFALFSSNSTHLDLSNVEGCFGNAGVFLQGTTRRYAAMQLNHTLSYIAFRILTASFQNIPRPETMLPCRCMS